MFLHLSNTKDKTPPLGRSNFVYKFNCSSCSSSYLRKKTRTLFVQKQEHAPSDKESAVYANIFAAVSFFKYNLFKMYAIYQIFLFIQISHLSI